jgi:competence protein ComFC
MDSISALAGARCVGCRRSGGLVCAPCLESAKDASVVQVPGVDRVSAVWKHEGPPRELILGLKLRGMRGFAEPLVDGLVDLVMRIGSEAQVVTWPPCSRSDKRSRGFDHAELLARGVAKELGLPARPLLRRVAATVDQTGLSGELRRRNLVGAFEAPASRGVVLLVDDVVTTGATLQACARALRDGGAAGIDGITACSAF